MQVGVGRLWRSASASSSLNAAESRSHRRTSLTCRSCPSSVAGPAPTRERVRGVVPACGKGDGSGLGVGRDARWVDHAVLACGHGQGVGRQRSLGRLRGVRGAVGQVERGDVVEADLAQAGRNATGEAGIAREVDLAQVGQPTQLAGNRSTQLVVLDAQIGQVGEFTQLSRDRAR